MIEKINKLWKMSFPWLQWICKTYCWCSGVHRIKCKRLWINSL